MSLSVVAALLNDHLSDFALAQTPALAVAWENRTFLPPASAAYLRPHLLPASVRAAALGAAAPDLQGGIFQVDVMGKQGVGWGAVMAVVDALRGHFSRGLRLTGTGVDLLVERAQVGPPMIEDTRYKVPVSIYFSAYMEVAA